MDNLKERLSAKLGPLPVWAWGLIAAVLAFIAYLYYQRSNTGVSSVVDPASIPTIDANGYQTVGIKGGTGTLVSDEPDNNQKWLSRAAKAVADAMGVSPSEVYAALSKWLQGQDFTAREQQFIDRAINLVMLPPEGTYGTGNRLPDPTNAVENPNPTAPSITLPGTVQPEPLRELTPITPNRTIPVAPITNTSTSAAPPANVKGKAPTPAQKVVTAVGKAVKAKAPAAPSKTQAPKGKSVRV